MTKLLAIEAALAEVRPLVETSPCHWGFSYKIAGDSGWITVAPQTYLAATASRRHILINKARRLMDKPEIDTTDCTGKKWEYFV